MDLGILNGTEMSSASVVSRQSAQDSRGLSANVQSRVRDWFTARGGCVAIGLGW